MECVAPEKCRFSLCKTDDFVFSLEIGCRSACEGPFDLIGGLLGVQNANHSVFNSICWMHKRAAWVDLGPHGSAASQRILRMTSVFVRKMIVCCVFATDWEGKLG